MGKKEEKAHEYASHKYMRNHDMSCRAEESFKAGWDAALQSLTILPKNLGEWYKIGQDFRDGKYSGIAALFSEGKVIARTDLWGFVWEMGEGVLMYGNRKVLALMLIPKLDTTKLLNNE